jgi:hypothetical protein
VNATTPPETEPAAPPPQQEQRQSPRFRILQRCFVWPPGADGADGWPCIVYDISLTGVGVALPIQMPRGSLLRIQPAELPSGRTLSVRVVHSSLVDYLWFSGCELIEPLDEAQQRIWVEGPRGLHLERLGAGPRDATP